MTFIQLYAYNLFRLTPTYTYNPFDLWGFQSPLDSNQAKEFHRKLQRNANLFGAYMAARVGFDWFF